MTGGTDLIVWTDEHKSYSNLSSYNFIHEQSVTSMSLLTMKTVFILRLLNRLIIYKDGY